MKLYGHPDLPYTPFYEIAHIQSIALTPSNSPLLFAYDALLCRYAKEHALMFGVYIHTVEALILAHALGASWLMVQEDLAQEAAVIAQHYLFDAQIVVCATPLTSIAQMAKLGVDALVYPCAIIKVEDAL